MNVDEFLSPPRPRHHGFPAKRVIRPPLRDLISAPLARHRDLVLGVDDVGREGHVVSPELQDEVKDDVGGKREADADGSDSEPVVHVELFRLHGVLTVVEV